MAGKTKVILVSLVVLVAIVLFVIKINNDNIYGTYYAATGPDEVGPYIVITRNREYAKYFRSKMIEQGGSACSPTGGMTTVSIDANGKNWELVHVNGKLIEYQPDGKMLFYRKVHNKSVFLSIPADEIIIKEYIIKPDPFV